MSTTFSLLTDHFPLPHFSFTRGKTVQEQQHRACRATVVLPTWNLPPWYLSPSICIQSQHQYSATELKMNHQGGNEGERQPYFYYCTAVEQAWSTAFQKALVNTPWAWGYFCSRKFLLFIWHSGHETQKVCNVLLAHWAAQILFILQLL